MSEQNPITVERIDTTPMTDREHADAVSALAVLITAWTTNRKSDTP
ncbi:hypothetical protein [Actinokineospora terrae]|uniref:Uncharacterized protein n=1 Tax=Actinokineospora terrae TaxID=155974 RepID=A0A1H9XSC0_9PSEU|nr:hypothetical protein [Actinokineospora terrae]SES49050.1 hypothetical protein SAMN04487818_1242 [Actinokineospora terrae]